MASERNQKRYVNCTFEGVYLGGAPVLKSDGSPVTTGKGDELVRLTIRTGSGRFETTLQVTMLQSTLDNAVGNMEEGVYVRIPGSISIDESDRGVYVSQWGNAIYVAEGVALNQPTNAITAPPAAASSRGR